MAVGNQTALVSAIKRDCLIRGIIGVEQTSNREPFEIVARVAWHLRSAGALLLRKSPSQNGYTIERGSHTGLRVSHDSLAFPDGWVDCLANAGPPSNVNAPAWQWHDSAAPPESTTVGPWNIDAELAGPIDLPPPPPTPPTPQPDESGLPTTWSTAPYLSLQWYTEMAASLEQVYRILLRRPADWGGAGNWVYHIVQGDRDPAWVIARFKESDEYKARHG